MSKSFGEQERALIRQAMLEITAELVRVKSIRQITVDEITQRAGISKGSFYTFYASREAMFWDAIKSEEKQLVDEIMAITAKEADIRDKLYKSFFDAFLRKEWIIYHIPEIDIQYLIRKLPAETVEKDMRNGLDINGMILTSCGFEATKQNCEFMMAMVQLIRITESKELILTDGAKRKIQELLVEDILTGLNK